MRILIPVLVAALISGLCPYSSTADCVDYGDYLRWVSAVPPRASPHGLPFDVGAALVGSVAYAGYISTHCGLQVIDISDPGQPVVTGIVNTSGYVRSITAAGNLVYFAEGYQDFGDVTVIDVANPTHPQIVGEVATPDVACKVALAGQYAFVAAWEAGLLVLDVSSAQYPTIVASLPTGGAVQSVAVANGFAYLLENGGRFRVIDITDPLHPHARGSYSMGGWDVAVAGTHAFLALDYLGVEVVDVADPDQPVVVGRLESTSAHTVTVADDRLYVGGGFGQGLQVADITVPVHPRWLGRISCPCGQVSVSGDYACAASGELGLVVMDVSNPVNPPPVRKPLPACATDLDIASGVVGIAGSSLGFKVVDLDDPAGRLREPVSLWPAITARTVAMGNGFAYVADDGTNLLVCNVTPPEASHYVGQGRLTHAPQALAVAGGVVLAAEGDAGLEVIDVSDPLRPLAIGLLDTPGSAVGVAVARNLAYVADGPAGLVVADIADPTRPAMVAQVTDIGWVSAVAAGGSYAYLIINEVMPAQLGSLHIYDVTDPERPVPVGSVVSLYAEKIKVRDTFAYTAGVLGMQVIDVSDPTAPRVVGGCEGDYAAVLALSGDEVWYNAQYCGEIRAAAFQCDDTRSTPLPERAMVATVNRTGSIAVTPNPSVGAATLRVTLAAPSDVHAEIFDAAGHRLRILYAGHLPAGDRTLGWDGRDEAGRLLASGLYLARVITPQGTDTARILRVR